jgi:methionyl-tRNA formyltransferase
VVGLSRLESAWFEHSGKRIRLLAAEVAEAATVGGDAPGAVLGVRRDGVLVKCGDGAVLVTTVQPEGKSAMTASAWANGARLTESAEVVSLA